MVQSRTMHGVIQLPEPCGLVEVNVAVQVIDASIMDIEAPVLAETRFTLNAHGERQIPFVLDAPAQTPEGRDIRIVAEVLASPAGSVAAGDYLTMESVRFEAQPVARRLEVPVEKVKPEGSS
jgi:hypothetical protein